MTQLVIDLRFQPWIDSKFYAHCTTTAFFVAEKTDREGKSSTIFLIKPIGSHMEAVSLKISLNV